MIGSINRNKLNLLFSPICKREEDNYFAQSTLIPTRKSLPTYLGFTSLQSSLPFQTFQLIINTIFLRSRTARSEHLLHLFKFPINTRCCFQHLKLILNRTSRRSRQGLSIQRSHFSTHFSCCLECFHFLFHSCECIHRCLTRDSPQHIIHFLRTLCCSCSCNHFFLFRLGLENLRFKGLHPLVELINCLCLHVNLLLKVLGRINLLLASGEGFLRKCLFPLGQGQLSALVPIFRKGVSLFFLFEKSSLRGSNFSVGLTNFHKISLHIFHCLVHNFLWIFQTLENIIEV
mmetsp:Transcript_24290/g.34785  ORF Transcript_24290/g.34785 Transcript_24290/m.34785 type:complete len:288 (+) Transcript_24290:961-1824(+)